MAKPLTVDAPALIAKKRDGKHLTAEELQGLIRGYRRGDVPDYQMSAFAMAVFFQGMSRDEIVALTLAMRDSGKVVRFRKSRVPRVDKHSTGGVGDKVSICLAPLVAASGVPVPMVSGRGLGHTGGTLDKLEAIPGFKVDLPISRFKELVKEHGFALIGQTEEIAPADRRLYALRDVTGTVESIPLITASILSKKLAEGIDALVLDCKVGRGAFMKTQAEARELARSIVGVGKASGLKTAALLTAMDQPLGRAVGNGLETIEALEVLHGGGPDDLRELTLRLGVEMLRLSGVAKGRAAEKLLEERIRDGGARRAMAGLVEAQGGDPRVVEEPDRLRGSRLKETEVLAPRAGAVQKLDSLEVAKAVMRLGAGRLRTTDPVDAHVGVILAAKVGDRVRKGDVLARIVHRRAGDGDRARDAIGQAFRLGRGATSPGPLVLEALR